ncbi:thiamine-phosphate kinase [Desulfopila sp. IMCC35008]|uniref:thiamine-phosphate kinase n=1 Tax=Desulfopila sp. IMCC35008 TaxID=2653858 RepID=UPI0013D112C9|nr:thiamine-phosphate kinase [Desulfopila sp. IMCC35008]
MRELELIKHIISRQSGQHPDLSCGIGDDCAVFNANLGEELLVTTDMLVENVHFDPSWHPPYLLGRKAISVNISDIAAMAGSPRFALLSIGMNHRFNNAWVKDFMDGVFSQLNFFGCTLIGGDTVKSDKLVFSVTIIGAAPKGNAIRRDGARSGDRVFVSGPLGSAAAGLQLFLDRDISINDYSSSLWPTLVRKHLDPTPRVRLAKLLGKNGSVTSMQDISDGIATDLSHICTAGRVKATLYSNRLPADKELYEMCREKGMDAVQLQLCGGEDYELVFTVKKEAVEKLRTEFRDQHRFQLYEIGVIEEGEGVYLQREVGEPQLISYQGYEHSP